MDTIIPARDLARIRHAIPYIYFLENARSRLQVFGSRHLGSRDVDEANILDTAIREFAPSVIVVEGLDPLHPNIPVDRRRGFIESRALESIEAALALGERGIALRYAKERSINVVSPESPAVVQKAWVEAAGWPAPKSDVYFFCRTLAFRSREHGCDLNRCIEELLDAKRPEHQWLNKFSPTELIRFLETDFPELSIRHLGDGQRFDPTLDPGDAGFAWTNSVAELLNRRRNEELCAGILRLAEAGNSIFVVYGASHAVAIEPALRFSFGHRATG